MSVRRKVGIPTSLGTVALGFSPRTRRAISAITVLKTAPGF